MCHRLPPSVENLLRRPASYPQADGPRGPAWPCLGSGLDRGHPCWRWGAAGRLTGGGGWRSGLAPLSGSHGEPASRGVGGASDSRYGGGAAARRAAALRVGRSRGREPPHNRQFVARRRVGLECSSHNHQPAAQQSLTDSSAGERPRSESRCGYGAAGSASRGPVHGHGRAAGREPAEWGTCPRPFLSARCRRSAAFGFGWPRRRAISPRRSRGWPDAAPARPSGARC